MAGDWMKIELDLADKPEVHYIATLTKLDPDAVIGKLVRVWAWFDKHTTDGNAQGVTFAVVDRMAGHIGFGEAMQFAGWLNQRGTMLSMPRFGRHNGQSAKKRALTERRVQRHRNAERNADSVTKTLPEKRREEKKGVGGISSTPTRIPRRQNLLKNPPENPADPDHIAKQKKVAELLLAGDIEGAKKVGSA